MSISKDRRKLALVWNVGGRSSLEVLELDTGLRIAVEGVLETIGGVSFSPDGAWLAIAANGSAAPPNIYMVGPDLTARRLTNAPHPGVDLETLVQPELVVFEAHDGLELSGWLYRAKNAQGPGPMVIEFHGGPEAQARPQWHPICQALVAEGISVLRPNIRGSTGFGKTFMNLDNLELRFNALHDIESCVRYVIEARLAESGRIGIMGGSYGGYMTMAGLTEYPDLFAAGVNICGIVDFQTFFKHTEPWMASISKLEYGDPDTQADLLRRLSPIHKLDRVRGATLVLHGANDTNVPLIEAEQIVDRLGGRAVPVDWVIFPDEGHGFTKTANRVSAHVKTARWFKQYLNGSGGSAASA
jgi:dipeptidyl aminopeptidase/acylaminoacyl peptidase